MALALVALVCGLIALVWSADRFVEGAAGTASRLGVPPLLIGMVIVGFGTSAPEMIVSALAAWNGDPGIALGNAYGSNITNIGLILGVTALISPIAFRSETLRRELPVLTLVSALAAWQLRDGTVSRSDALFLLLVFGGLLAWSIREGRRNTQDSLAAEVESGLDPLPMSFGRSIFWMIAGLIALILSSRALVWGAVTIAQQYGVSDLVIGLTVVAVGTSLPELASSVVAARKGEHDIALGNVLGSNLFNTLAVVGLAGSIHPLAAGPEVLSRDMLVMCVLTISLFFLGYGFRGPGRINRVEGGALLFCFIAYTAYLLNTAL